MPDQVNLHNRHRKVYERDNWECQMPVCVHPDGRVIDKTLLGADDQWGPSIDHVIPRAEGGSSGVDNLRASHKECNNAAGRSVTASRSKNRGLSSKIGEVYPDLLTLFESFSVGRS